jgi:hypothetical protein
MGGNQQFAKLANGTKGKAMRMRGYRKEITDIVMEKVKPNMDECLTDPKREPERRPCFMYPTIIDFTSDIIALLNKPTHHLKRENRDEPFRDPGESFETLVLSSTIQKCTRAKLACIFSSR